MKTKLLVIVGLIVFLIPLSDVYASCATFIPGIDNIKAYDEASTVFLGTVIKAHEQQNSDSGTAFSEYTTFDVHYLFKGSLIEGQVRTNPRSSTGYEGFEEGQTYFVYAYDPANEVYECIAPTPFPFAFPILILHFPFVLIPIGIISGVVIIWRKRK
ncbi:hypothetical protein [Nitrosopumilus ureiphilus]|jgi:hypothetical protein|uniref:hypothetical protein n=1 Tax=Nitrosopumilus ureiphilus TaxID=1470067 RepID=UPI0015CAB353|nr:hypothetical protein [Nitrosopumilus ureiphilus]